MTKPSPNELYRAAQVLAREGQPVFPCHSSGPKAKAPYTPNGFKDATTDRAQLKRWWQRWPNAAIGIPTGIIWDVLDVDVKREEDGRVHLPTLQLLGMLDGCQRVVKTPSGGWHLYFKTAPGLTNKANAALGLDVRSKGGYVIAPPSYMSVPEKDGDPAYEGPYIDVGPTKDATDKPLFWEAIRNSIAPIASDTKQPIAILPSEKSNNIAALREWVSHLRPGERNNGLFWAVCRCIEHGIDPHELIEPVTLTDLSEDEATFTVEQAMIRAGLTEGDLMSEAEAMFAQGS